MNRSNHSKYPPPNYPTLESLLRWRSHEGQPLFECFISERCRDNPSDFIVWFSCPGCGRVHYHGWNDLADPTIPQHKAAHCTAGPLELRGYFLILWTPPTARKAVLA